MRGERMPAFASQRQPTVGSAIERHRELVDQHRLDQLRAFLREREDGLLMAQPGARVDDVLRQRIGRVALAMEDDAALRPVGVGFAGAIGAGDHR